VRFRDFIIHTTIFKQRVQALERHLGTVFGKPDFIQDADGSKTSDVSLLLELLTLPECGKDSAGRGERAALERDHVDLHEVFEKLGRVGRVALHHVWKNRGRFVAKMVHSTIFHV